MALAGQGRTWTCGWVFGGNSTTIPSFKGDDINNNYIGGKILGSLILKNEEPTFRVISVRPLYESTTLKAESPVCIPPLSSNQAATVCISPLNDFRP